MAKLQPGDHVAFSAKFLRDTCQHTGRTPARRGVLLSIDAPSCRVRWDDENFGQYADDPEYVAEVTARGVYCSLSSLAKVGSARFACNDLA